MKAEEILDKIETQLEQALDCYNKASVGGSDTDLEKKKYHAKQLLGMVRVLRAEDQQLPCASRFKQVSEIAMDVEIEAAKERNEQLRTEIRELTNANRCIVMRAIKFRGFNTKENKWVYGCYLMHDGCHYIIPEASVGYEVAPETIGQFTGLVDEHGQEVYEGDVVSYIDSTGPVTRTREGKVYWNENFYRFMVCTGMGDYDLSDSDLEHLTLLGANVAGKT